jgi:hypothetical protein
LDLALASVLRKRFGSEGLIGEEGTAEFTSEWAKLALRQVLTGVAALYDPAKTAPSNLFLLTTFAGFDKGGVPIVKQLLFIEKWVPSGPLSNLTPDYQVLQKGETIQRFTQFTAGITCVADAILGGYYKSEDAVIQRYYQKRRDGLLDSLPLEEMKTLAQVILRETRNFTNLVGGKDEIGIFPVSGDIQWLLPPLPSDKHLPARFFLWNGLECTDRNPECKLVNGGADFFEDFQRALDESITKFFLASQFKDIAVVVDNNYFVRDSFEGTTLKWRGGPIFMRSNNFHNCILELTEHAEVPGDSELNGKCKLVRKAEVSFESTTVGAPIKYQTSGCVEKSSNGGVTITAGDKCGNAASIFGPPIQP